MGFFDMFVPVPRADANVPAVANADLPVAIARGMLLGNRDVHLRQPQAGNQTMWSLGLRDLDPHGLYCVRHHDAGWIREMTGAELASLSVTLPQPGSCALISYRACSAPIRQETGMFVLHSPEIAGARKDAWTVETEDTRLTVGATHEGQLVVYELSNPSAGWNWTAEPSVFDLPRMAGAAEGLRWQFREGVHDKSQGQKITLRFTCPEPALELESVWWARPGRGPVQHSRRIVNRSGGVGRLDRRGWTDTRGVLKLV